MKFDRIHIKYMKIQDIIGNKSIHGIHDNLRTQRNINQTFLGLAAVMLAQVLFNINFLHAYECVWFDQWIRPMATICMWNFPPIVTSCALMCRRSIAIAVAKRADSVRMAPLIYRNALVGGPQLCAQCGCTMLLSREC